MAIEAKVTTLTDYQTGEKLAPRTTPEAAGAVPAGRKVNNKPLTADITLTAGDVGAYTKEESTEVAENAIEPVGTIKSTVRTDLGDKWLLCNGEGISPIKNTELSSIIPVSFKNYTEKDSLFHSFSKENVNANTVSMASSDEYVVLAYFWDDKLNIVYSTDGEIFNDGSQITVTNNRECLLEYINGYFVFIDIDSFGSNSQQMTIYYTDNPANGFESNKVILDHGFGEGQTVKYPRIKYLNNEYVIYGQSYSSTQQSYTFYHGASLNGSFVSSGSKKFPFSIYYMFDLDYFNGNYFIFCGNSTSTNRARAMVLKSNSLNGTFSAAFTGSEFYADSNFNCSIQDINNKLFFICPYLSLTTIDGGSKGIAIVTEDGQNFKYVNMVGNTNAFVENDAFCYYPGKMSNNFYYLFYASNSFTNYSYIIVTDGTNFNPYYINSSNLNYDETTGTFKTAWFKNKLFIPFYYNYTLSIYYCQIGQYLPSISFENSYAYIKAKE